ncbi:hypothetical protein [Paraburkholderia sp. SIMBA_054]|uniref:hypothetical protein n=1 Tax=Paraburkholderia sp. SIMBA_054 TaxID=3085795 RepID=UPI00397D80D7
MHAQHYDIAYEKLVDYLLHFCVSRIYGEDNASQQQPRTFGGHTGWVSLELNGDPALIEGDLLLLAGHKQPKWRMAWLKKVRKSGMSAEYLAQSVMGDGEQTWMSNVEVSHFHRPTLAQHPEWRWTNEQHQFADTWINVVSEHRNTQLIAPMMPVFLGDSVTLKARARFGLEDSKPSITLPDFRSISSEELLQCYDTLCQKHDTFRASKAPAMIVHPPAEAIQ